MQIPLLCKKFLLAEMMTMLQEGQWIILPYADVQNLENLWLSPLGAVPQQDHWPCTITD